MIIKLDPHGFMVFITLAMGMSYAMFHSYSGWGFWKIAVVAIFVVPFAYMGIVLGHPIEIILGGLIGGIYARGGFTMPSFDWLLSLRVQRSKQHQRSQTQSNSGSHKERPNAEEEIKRRQRQAQQEREAQREQQESEHASSSQAEDPKSEYSSSSQDQRSKKQHDVGPLNPTNIDDAFKILGLERGVSLSEAKQAYRTLISIYNSDKISRLSGHRKAQAEEEAKDINRAWATIKKWHNA